MDCDEDAGEVKHCREYRSQRDLGIGHVHVFRHEEGGGAHDGRHYLSAGGGRGLNGARKIGAVAGLFHHGNGDGAGRDGIADGGAGDHAAERGGDDRDLGGTAGEATDKRICKAYEELRNTGALKESAEDNKDNNILGADVNGRGEYAVGGVEYSANQSGNAFVEPVFGDEHIAGVNHQYADDTKYRYADAAAAELHEAQKSYNADNNIYYRELILVHEHGCHVAIV